MTAVFDRFARGRPAIAARQNQKNGAAASTINAAATAAAR